MKPSLAQISFPATRPPRVAVVLFVIGIAFWPVFMLLTVLERSSEFSWLRIERADIWLPIMAFALLSAAAAPFFLQFSIGKKIAASVVSSLGFFVMYGFVAVIGVSFLDWGD